MPYRHSDSYVEIEPCAALKPYIRCFWGSRDIYTLEAGVSTENVVVPDTCMDVIFTVNYTDNSLSDLFCGIDDRAFSGGGTNMVSQCLSVFAVRFYAWSAVLFAEESMRTCRNFYGGVGGYFSWLVRALGDDGDCGAGAAGGRSAASENGFAAGKFGFYGCSGGDSFTARRSADARACAGYPCERQASAARISGEYGRFAENLRFACAVTVSCRICMCFPVLCRCGRISGRQGLPSALRWSG